jgi:hypothetical protein
VGSKGVSHGTLSSAHPNYILGSASIIVSQRPVNLLGSRTADNNLIVNASELSIGNLVNNENLTLSGSGTISSSIPGSFESINLLSLSIANGIGASAGLASNYTLVGGSHFMSLRNVLTTVQRIRRILKVGISGKSVNRTPSRITYRRVPAISERASIATPDQSIEVRPCVLQSGYCN